jgi:hypothetical protein
MSATVHVLEFEDTRIIVSSGRTAIGIELPWKDIVMKLSPTEARMLAGSLTQHADRLEQAHPTYTRDDLALAEEAVKQARIAQSRTDRMSESAEQHLRDAYINLHKVEKSIND